MQTPRITPSIVISSLALIVALSGSAVAATGMINGASIKPHSITAKQIKAHAITKPALAAGVIPTATTSPGTPGANGAPGVAGASGASGANGSPGVNGSPGAPGTVRAYASVNANGTLAASKNIVSVSVAVGSGGSIYCVIVAGVDTSQTAPVVSVVTPYPQDASAYSASIRPSTPFCNGDSRLVEVETKKTDSNGLWVNAPEAFEVMVP